MTDAELVTALHETVAVLKEELEDSIEELTGRCEEVFLPDICASQLREKCDECRSLVEELNIYRIIFSSQRESCETLNIREICESFASAYNRGKINKKSGRTHTKRLRKERHSVSVITAIYPFDPEWTPEERNECWCVHHYSPLFYMLFSQLMDNAVKYNLPGNPIKISVTVDEDFKMFTISNLGPRLKPQEAQQLFSPEFRGNNAKRMNARGQGLGLYFANEIARMQGVRIELAPKEGNPEKEKGDYMYENIPYEAFTIRVIFPSENPETSEAVSGLELFTCTSGFSGTSQFLHEIKRTSNQTFAMTLNLFNWAHSNKKQIDLLDMAGRMLKETVRLIEQTYLIEFLLTEKHEIIELQTAETKNCMIAKVMPCACNGMENIEQETGGSFEIIWNEKMLYVLLCGFIELVYDRRPFRHEPLEMTVNRERKTIEFVSESGFDPLFSDREPEELPEIKDIPDLDVYKTAFYQYLVKYYNGSIFQKGNLISLNL